MPTVEIQDGQRLNIGNPDGPELSFDVGRHEGGRPPTTSIPVAGPSGARPTSQPRIPPPPTSRPQPYPSGAQPGYPSTQQPRYPSGPQPSYTGSQAQPTRSPVAVSQQVSQSALSQPALESVTSIGPTAPPLSSEGNLATSMLKILRPAALGRAARLDQDRPQHRQRHRHPRRAGVAPPCDVGAHRRVTQIRDNRSINGTFVNGSRVETAVLHEGDTVTIGNVDLVFRGGTLVRRTETAADTSTGGLDVHGVTWTIEGNNKTLLDNISLDGAARDADRPHRPIRRGQVDLRRLVAGYTHPTTGTVAFEGHDIHAEYAWPRSRIGMVPQDDVVHGQLTVNQALMYAAELRLPPDTNKEDRERVVAQVLEELDPTRHAAPCVDKLSGGSAQARIRGDGAADRPVAADSRRADVGPRPRAGPAGHDDAASARRRGPRGDGGHPLLVLPHVPDQVLLLAPGGKTAFAGPPGQIGAAMGTTNWADIFSSVAHDPDAAYQRFLAGHGPTPRNSRPRGNRRTSVTRRAPACDASSRRSRGAR